MKLRTLLELPLLAFSLTVSVPAGTIWDGGGIDTNINTAANWDGDSLPTLTGGSTTLTFGTGGSSTIINTNVDVAGIAINRDGNFEIANGTGSLSLRSSGITVTLPTTSARSHTISESNIILLASQNWSVTNNTGAASLSVSSSIDDGASTFAITKLGDGLLTLSGNNSFGATGSNGLILGTNPGTSPYTNTGGIIRLASNTAAGVGRIAVYGGYQTGRLELTGNITVSNRIELYGRQGPTYAAINNFSGNNTLSGEWNITANGSSINVSSDSGKLTISGSAPTGATSRTLTFLGNGEIEFSKIVNSAVFSAVRTFGAGVYHLTQDNTYAGATDINNNGTLRISHANALGTTAVGTTVVSGGTLDISGNITTAAEALGLSGNGVGSNGALRNSSGNNTYSGAITLNAASQIHSDTGTLILDVTSGNAISSSGAAVTFGGAGNIEVRDPISLGSGSLTKEGSGTLTLEAGGSYTGTTTVSNGKLILNGNISTSSTTVQSGGTLAGTGTSGPLTVQNNGTLAPGNSAGTLWVDGGLGLNESSILHFEFNPLNQAIGSNINDLVSVTGNLTLNGLLNVTSTAGSFNTVTSGSWRLFNYTGALTDNLLTINTLPELANGYSWTIDTTTSGQVNLAVVPEPSALLLGGLGILACLRRRRQA